MTIPPEHARAGFYGRCEEADVQAALRRICREPIGPLAQALQLGTSFAAVKKTYVGATHDRAVPPALQPVLAERAGAAFQMIASDHSPFYSARADLIRILLCSTTGRPDIDCAAVESTIRDWRRAARPCPGCLRCRGVPVPQLAQRCPQSATSARFGIDTKAIPDTRTDSELQLRVGFW